MASANFIKNITSKDINLSRRTILEMLKEASSEDFSELCDKSDFIFPFLKERITKDFISLVESDDIDTIFDFSNIYSADFEDMIVLSLIKFDSDDIKNRISNLLKEGNDSQKAYAVRYFIEKNDNSIINFIKDFSKSDFYFLKINAACALNKFSADDIYEEAKKEALSCEDDFEKLSYIEFIAACKKQDAIQFIAQCAKSSPLKISMVSTLFDFFELNEIKNILDEDSLVELYCALIEGYPEDIGLDSVGYYGILDFSKLIYSFATPFALSSLIEAKLKFEEYSTNDIYLFDLDKNSKQDVKELFEYLKSLNLDFYPEFEIENRNEFLLELNLIEELRIEKYCEKIAELINSNLLKDELLAKSAMVLKNFNKANLINSSILDNIENKNVKALVESLL